MMQVTRKCKCPACAPSLHREDGPDCCLTGDSFCPPCELPEAASLASITRDDQPCSRSDCGCVGAHFVHVSHDALALIARVNDMAKRHAFGSVTQDNGRNER